MTIQTRAPNISAIKERMQKIWSCGDSFDFVLSTLGVMFCPKRAFESLDSKGREALKRDLKELIGFWNISGDETVVLPSDYLEVVAIRR